MPIYEYLCQDCRRRVSIFWRNFSDLEQEVELQCPRCEGTNLKRLISRVAVGRSKDAGLDALSDPASLSGLDENDPKSIARWMRRMSKETGEDLGSEFDEVVGAWRPGKVQKI